MQPPASQSARRRATSDRDAGVVLPMTRSRAQTRPRTVRRGRPFKFGRPSRTIVISLPDDVVEWLRSIHRDLAWAVVTLFQEHGSAPERRGQRDQPPAPPAELVALPGRRGLIVVEPQLQKLPGVSLIPLQDGRAFLALEPDKGLADLELAVIDSLEAAGSSGPKARRLEIFRQQLREWRRTPGLRFTTRAIILAEGLRAPSSRRRRPRR